jgi:hypothetical protein
MRPLGILSYGWENNIKTDFTEVGPSNTESIWLGTGIRAACNNRTSDPVKCVERLH